MRKGEKKNYNSLESAYPGPCKAIHWRVWQWPPLRIQTNSDNIYNTYDVFIIACSHLILHTLLYILSTY